MKQITARRTGGFTMVEIMIVVTIIGLLLLMAIPNFMKNRQVAQTNTCVSNLRVLDTAKQLWAMETGQGDVDVPDESDLVGFGLYLSKMPSCPANGEYAFNQVDEWPSCDALGGTAHVFADE